MTTQLLIRLDSKRKSALASLSRSEGRNASDVVRELIDHYIREHDLCASLGELWDRAGARIRKAGNTEKDLDAQIKAWRRSRA